MITPSDGVNRKKWGDLAQPDGGMGRRKEVALGTEGHFSSLLRRRARNVVNDPTDELAAEEDLRIVWDPATPVMGGAARTGRDEYLPVTKTYDELPHFELTNEEASAAYEPVTTEYRPPAKLKGPASIAVAGRTIAKDFGTDAGVEETGTEYDTRTTDLKCAPGATKVLGSGDYWSALKAKSPLPQAIGAAFGEARSSLPTVENLPSVSSDESFRATHSGGRFGELAAELLRRRVVSPEEPSALAGSRKGRRGTSFPDLLTYRRKINSRLWAVGLAVTLVVLSWMILVVR